MKKTNYERNQATTILLVEKKQNGEVGFFQDLIRRGFTVHLFENGTAGLRKIDSCNPDLIIINAASLRTNGQRIVNRFHNLKPETPKILILNAANDEEIKSCGANSTLRLPFTIQKLVNCIRLYEKTPEKQILSCGDLRLNCLTNVVSRGEKESRLTPRLVSLLKILVEKPGVVHSREDLFREVWQTDYTGDTRTLDVHISWLRNAIELDPAKPELILTIRGLGYKLVV